MAPGSRRTRSSSTPSRFSRQPSAGGKRDHERRAFADVAVDGDLAVHRFDEMLHDREAEPGAAVLPRASRIDPIEAFEEARQMLARDARSVVRDPDEDLAVHVLRLDPNDARLLAVLDRVVDEVQHGALEAFAI